MTAADWTIGAMWVGVTAYVLLAGADFGAGFWDLLAGGSRRGAEQRDLIEHSIGPVWEANHVWLIFVIVLCWAGFPGVFASVASTMYVPLMLVALGIIARGAAFAFRKASAELGHRRAYGACFALSSVLTPFFLGTVAGGIASGRVPLGIAAGDLITSWLNPTSFLAGTLAVGTTAYLAAVYLCADARRAGAAPLAEQFRSRGIATGAVTGVIALAGIAVLLIDSPALYRGLIGPGLPLVVISAVAGLASAVLLLRRNYLPARLSAAVAVAALPWGWAVAQYPLVLLPDTTIESAAAQPTVLHAVLVTTLIGAVLLIPSLLWMFALFQRGTTPGRSSHGSAADSGS
ncbi:cytochrome bd-I ubiquinol oxidase subunit 2 apoprotein [Saccharopolyspora kobensis]|uniref:Cytochrome bd-I ubiquinol oxidase subunit 2 apoprotein n=1 Tax=Saccharopolyspora kobensis TaxID=146035 RepID=A0A1H5VIF2_9PSEU|nr:cytochrome d ubiquinol oxidase subunit II [Saccharopolyspora kobensis]SEF87145.1 cytochrome bd-I ubiquinol oxidase subunit 2 apoprotein [Saccharopolyspora kobensis]SFC60348.1 cytochrome bd-I ubiquinol oxidase subunit 2 apoprotein [Saccharopolyspora kobensis]